MSEITKLYENAGVKPTYTDECQMADSYYSMAKDLNERGILFDDYMKQECPNKNEMCYETCPYAYNKEFYPPFTAEKQLELIKWLAIKGDFAYTVDIAKNTDAYWTIYFDDSRWTAEEFEETFAGLINQLWQDLTEEEKEQIRGILNATII